MPWKMNFSLLRRFFLRKRPQAALIGLLFLSPSPALSSDSPGAQGHMGRQNVLLITMDTTRADVLSCYGYPLLTTPNVDRLAARGTRFTQASTIVPLTGPAHASLLTGLSPRDHGAVRNGVRMAPDLPTLQGVLALQGYRTGAFVSGWTLRANLTGLDEGFQDYDDEMTDRYQMVNSQRPGDETTDRALAWLEKNGREPFFLWVHLFDPHYPYHDHKTEIPLNPHGRGDPPRRKELRRYAQEVHFTDAQIGRVLDKVEELGVLDSTLVALTADHGEAFGEHGEDGHGRHIYQTTMHVPLILSHPSLPRGQASDLPTSTVDILPTILNVLGLPGWSALSGLSLGKALQAGETYTRRKIHMETYSGARKKVWGAFSPKLTGQPIKVGIRQGDWKAILDPSSEKLVLFNLADDQGESTDLSVKVGYRAEHYLPELVSYARKEWKPEAGQIQLTEEDRRRLRSLGYTD